MIRGVIIILVKFVTGKGTQGPANSQINHRTNKCTIT